MDFLQMFNSTNFGVQMKSNWFFCCRMSPLPFVFIQQSASLNRWRVSDASRSSLLILAVSAAVIATTTTTRRGQQFTIMKSAANTIAII